jgi:AcrR family transcriptional regulator
MLRTAFATPIRSWPVALTASEPPRPGSAPWWLARSRARPERRPRKDGITLERIVAVAVDVVQAEGHEALTMRRVAERLATGPASLYRHVAGRDELVALVVDHVLGSVPRERAPAGDWRTKLEWWARHFRAHLLVHRAFVPLITSAQLLGPCSMQGREAIVSMLVRQGFRPVDAVRTQLIVQHWIVATVQLDVRAAARTPAERRQLRELFAGQDPARFPTVVAHADILSTQRSEDEFEFGLRAMLDGVAGLRSAPDAT